MTPSRLWTRLGRLEEQASHLYCSADMMAELLTYLAQAGTQAALAPEVLQPLCTAVRHRLEDFAQQFPRRSTSDATQDAMVKALMTTLSATIQAEIPEPSTRARLNKAIHRVLQDTVEAERRPRGGECTVVPRGRQGSAGPTIRVPHKDAR